MALNYIWIAFFLIGFIVALCQLIFAGNMQIFNELVNSVFLNAKTGFEISLGLTGALTLWMGLLKVGEKGGVVAILGRLIGPLFEKLFPGLPKGHPAYGSIMLNISANMLGLDNAATPVGLKAMKEMHDVNPDKETASNAQIMFLVINAAGLTIIPVSIIDTQFTAALPVAFMKPLSGSGARGLMIDAMTTYGADSFIGRLACTMQGTTDTTFYIVAVYFGSVGIKNTRYSIGCGLLADLAGFTAAIFVAYLFFT